MALPAADPDHGSPASFRSLPVSPLPPHYLNEHLPVLAVQDCAAMTLASLRTLLATVNRPDLEVVYKK